MTDDLYQQSADDTFMNCLPTGGDSPGHLVEWKEVHSLCASPPLPWLAFARQRDEITNWIVEQKMNFSFCLGGFLIPDESDAVIFRLRWC